MMIWTSLSSEVRTTSLCNRWSVKSQRRSHYFRKPRLKSWNSKLKQDLLRPLSLMKVRSPTFQRTSLLTSNNLELTRKMMKKTTDPAPRADLKLMRMQMMLSSTVFTQRREDPSLSPWLEEDLKRPREMLEPAWHQTTLMQIDLLPNSQAMEKPREICSLKKDQSSLFSRKLARSKMSVSERTLHLVIWRRGSFSSW